MLSKRPTPFKDMRTFRESGMRCKPPGQRLVCPPDQDSTIILTPLNSINHSVSKDQTWEVEFYGERARE